MQVKVLLFGQLADILGNSEIYLEDVSNSDMLIETLHLQYPELLNFKYAIALDNKVISRKMVLRDNSTIALLPPFSGG
ncbi:MAG: MoaD/ThiS family protein [Daejeonella sp.]